MFASTAAIALPLLAAGNVLAYDALLGFKGAPAVENRTIEEIYQAALNEGGVVTCWHGGDEANQQGWLKQAFEARFPGITLNLTIDLSKYHDGGIDQQLADSNVYVDSIILQTVHDYPRWADQGALLHYAPLAWYGLFHASWQLSWSTDKLPNVTIAEFDDFLKPELKNKLVLTYPNDDDAVLFAFDLVMQQYGTEWFDGLLAQNPRWVRGTATASQLIRTTNETAAATFTSFAGFGPLAGVKATFPTKAQFVTWAQTAAILKDAPHPEAAKLLHAFILMPEQQQATGWPVRQDVPLADDFPLPPLHEVSSTNAAAFGPWMADRSRVERLRFFFEKRIGTAQGLSSLVDDL
ncbi:ABC transporter [Dactylonectria estremocensis]|uniref:ABC transporter n=1 Tax=Dactylonectria estremocensis TaxID=1079267 RepID=A0A9P9F042_9HYPO|nr:ABC transporter [Dactylonectria estremocensis]